MPANDRSHYAGTYRTRSKAVREAAYADPATRCWRCGKTLAEVPGSSWHAGHTVDGNSNHPLAPEHSSCNTQAGAQAGHAKRALNPSRRWY